MGASVFIRIKASIKEFQFIVREGITGCGGAVCEDIHLLVNVFQFVFNTQFVVSKHDHIQQTQQRSLETKYNCKSIQKLEAVLRHNDGKYMNN